MKYVSKIKDLIACYYGREMQLRKPVVLQFPINNICNSRCKMCNLWKNKLREQLTPDQIKEILSNPLFEDVQSVGINGGEPTLRTDVREVCEALTGLPKLENVTLITNALLARKTIEQIESIRDVLSSKDVKLYVMVSLDGIGDVHDDVRGVKGAFDNAVKVIDYLEKNFSKDTFQVCCTVMSNNVFGLDDLLDWCIKRDLYIKFRLATEHRRLCNSDLASDFSLSLEAKHHFVTFLEEVISNYEKKTIQKIFYRSLINQILYNSPRATRCDWQYHGVTLLHDGKLAYCATQSPAIGDALTEDSMSLYFENKSILENIKNNYCDSCIHDYSGYPCGKLVLKYSIEALLSRYNFSLKSIKKSFLLSPLRFVYRRVNFARRLRRYNSAAQVSGNVRKVSVSQKSVMICGWYGTETLGDKAILGSIVNSIGEHNSEIKIYLVSLNPYLSEVTKKQMPELGEVEILSVEDAFEYVLQMDSVIFGGGPLMAIDNLAEMIAIFKTASAAKIPTVLAGCGVGPLGAGHLNKAVKEIIELADYRIFRDQNSKDLSTQLGIDTSNAFVAEDPAYSWIVKKDLSLSENIDVKNGPTLLLALRDWPYSEYSPELSRKSATEIRDNFNRQLIVCLKELIKKHTDLRIVPFPMCTNHFGNDDRWYYRNLFRGDELLSNKLDYSALSKELKPDEALSYFKSADTILSMRFHSLVFSLAMNKPVVSFDYTMGKGKVNSLAKKFNVPCYTLDAVDNVSLTSDISDMIYDRDKYSSVNDDVALSFNEKFQKVLKQIENFNG